MSSISCSGSGGTSDSSPISLSVEHKNGRILTEINWGTCRICNRGILHQRLVRNLGACHVVLSFYIIIFS